MPTKRDARIDEARGIGTLLVVIFHATRAEPTLAPTLYYQVNEALALVRMPLFMIVSGYLLGRQASSALRKSLRRWVVRVAWPLVTVTICCVALLHIRGEPWPIARALLFGIWHLWYLQALIVLKIAYVAFDARCRPNQTQQIGLAVAAALLAWSGFADRLTLFSIARAIDLMPFLLIGAWLGRNPGVLAGGAPTGLLYVVAAALLVLLILGPTDLRWARTSPIELLIGAGSGLFILQHAPRSALLSTIGRYGFPIFLWHLPWFVAVEDLVLAPTGLTGLPAVACRVFAGLLLPAIVARSVRGWPPGFAIPIGGAVPPRRLPSSAEATGSGYRGPFRRFAPGMNHPC